MTFTNLREYLPLEQGLRLYGKHNEIKACALREYLPLEQGLRHPKPNATSTNIGSESIFH